jgi:hypothetical protein
VAGKTKTPSANEIGIMQAGNYQSASSFWVVGS